MSSKNYWREREERQRKLNIKNEAEYQKKLDDIYADMLENIEKDGICLLDRYNTNFENITNACMKACRRIKRILPKSFAMV